MTSGASPGARGTGRWPDWAVAYAVLVVATLLINSINVLSLLHERDQMAQPLPWWKPAVWEGTSGMVLLALAWVPLLMIRRFPLHGRRALRNLTLHLAASIPFSLAHVALMIVLREAAYATLASNYEFAGGGGALLYEYRKDLLSYAAFAAVFDVTRRLRGRDEADRPPRAIPPDLFEIDEGQRLIRVSKSEILCARSSGNYVEFFLADGRRPLMRTTLAGLEARLADAGFVRTHRSWLANPAHVVEAVAEGSGDYGLRLADGTDVPLSRRYPGALASLRGARGN